ncbi:MAG: hypothetical protein AABW47_04580, partial [Nanoarchaeota archaeon]
MEEKKTSILEQIEEFLEYLAEKEYDEEARKEENLKIKFGEDEYKRIYSLIGGKYTGGLPKKEEDKRYLVFYINDEGLKFLEERQERRKKENHDRTISSLTTILALTGIITLIKSIWDKP